MYIIYVNNTLPLAHEISRHFWAAYGRIEGDSLSANEINEAHTLWIKEIQQALPEKGEFEHWKFQFGLYRDERNVWRCKGRLGKANVPLMTKHPIILDKSHHLTTLIIRECHSR